MKYLLVTIGICSLLFSCNDAGGKVGGPCHYATLEFKSVGLGWDDDSYKIFRFESLETKRSYGLDSLEMLDHGLSIEDLKEGGNYKLVIREITEGSCVPFEIKDIERLD